MYKHTYLQRVNYYYSINGIVGACPLGNQIKPEPMSQRPAAFEMQPGHAKAMLFSLYQPPIRPFSCSIHSSIHPSIQLILCCVCFILAKVRVPLKFNTNLQLQHSPMHSSLYMRFHYKYEFTAACSQHCGIISLQPKSKPSHLTPYMAVFSSYSIAPFFPNPNTPPAFYQRHSALASSPHCSLVCKHCARR